MRATPSRTTVTGCEGDGPGAGPAVVHEPITSSRHPQNSTRRKLVTTPDAAIGVPRPGRRRAQDLLPRRQRRRSRPRRSAGSAACNGTAHMNALLAIAVLLAANETPQRL